ncbi:hypothetical protein B0H34DRAFT_391360 [Crassisporium funariophilum]|nr:hypothetical protein B0H34DRAFT_391360 [Crassisporium funariophilum]
MEVRSFDRRRSPPPGTQDPGPSKVKYRTGKNRKNSLIRFLFLRKERVTRHGGVAVALYAVAINLPLPFLFPARSEGRDVGVTHYFTQLCVAWIGDGTWAYGARSGAKNRTRERALE